MRTRPYILSIIQYIHTPHLAEMLVICVIKMDVARLHIEQIPALRSFRHQLVICVVVEKK